MQIAAYTGLDDYLTKFEHHCRPLLRTADVHKARNEELGFFAEWSSIMSTLEKKASGLTKHRDVMRDSMLLTAVDYWMRKKVCYRVDGDFFEQLGAQMPERYPDRVEFLDGLENDETCILIDASDDVADQHMFCNITRLSQADETVYLLTGEGLLFGPSKSSRPSFIVPLIPGRAPDECVSALGEKLSHAFPTGRFCACSGVEGEKLAKKTIGLILYLSSELAQVRKIKVKRGSRPRRSGGAPLNVTHYSVAEAAYPTQYYATGKKKSQEEIRWFV